MVEVQVIYLVLGALAIFVIGALWGRGIMWRIWIGVGYAFWRLSGGLKRLLDCHDAASVQQLLGVPEHLAWAEGIDATFWVYMPLAMPGEGELGEGELFVGDTLQVADFDGHGEFCKKLGVGVKDTSVMLTRITFFNIFVFGNACAEGVCHRRMSLPLLTYCTRVVGLPGCLVCGASFANVILRAPEYMERRARQRAMEAIAGVRGGKDGELKCFALQHPNAEGSAVCFANGRTAELQVFFGDAAALELWGERMKKPLRPLTLEVMVPKKL